MRFPAPYRPAGSSASAGGGTRSGAGTSVGTPQRSVDRYRSVKRPTRPTATLDGRGTALDDPRRVHGGHETARPSRPSSGGESGGRTTTKTRGTTAHGSSSHSAPTSDTTRTVRPNPVRSPGDRAGTRSHPTSPGKGAGGKADSPLVKYASGPRARPETQVHPRPVGEKAVMGEPGRGDAQVRPRGPSSGKPGRGSALGGVRGSAVKLDRPGRVRATRPTKDPGVRAAAGAVSLGHDLVVGASLAAVGGVYATPYLGAYGNTYGAGAVGWYGYPSSYGYYHYGYSTIPGCYYSPFGFGFTGTGWAFALTFGLDDWYYCPWYWGAYTAAWLPVWYSVYRPYEPYYRTEVVYETVVIDNTTQAAQPTVAAPPAPAPAAQQPAESESAAADRYLQLGDQAFRDGRYTDAVQLYAKAIEFSPEDGALYFVLSDALFAAGDYHYGAYAIRRGLELDHTLVQAEVDKHEFYGDPSLFDHQLAVLEQYLVDHPADRDARLVLALNDLFGRRPAAAVDLLEAPEASALAEDSAALLILDAARAAQYGR